MRIVGTMRQILRTWWYFCRVTVQAVRGVWHVNHLVHPVVTIFGASHLKKDNQYEAKAEYVAKKLVEADISVITGGGAGIMQAANCGASSVSSYERHSMGVRVSGLTTDANVTNPCAQEVVVVDDFHVRKYIMERFASAFIVFPGGLGTLDELADISNRMRTGKLAKVPIVLIGVSFWQPFLESVKQCLAEEFIQEQDLRLWVQTDDCDEAVRIIVEHCKGTQTQ